MILVAEGDFGQFRVVLLRRCGKRYRRPLIRKDLRVEKGALRPVDIFPHQGPSRRLFHVRSGTAWSRA
jgi:hypothetical protein